MKVRDMIVDGRLKTGHTQDTLAELLKCHPMTISQIERGVVEIPTKHVLNIIRALKLNKEEFVDAYLKDKMEHIKKNLK